MPEKKNLNLKVIMAAVLFACLFSLGLIFLLNMPTRSSSSMPLRDPLPQTIIVKKARNADQDAAKETVGQMLDNVIDRPSARQTSGDFVRESTGLSDSERSETYILRDRGSGRRFLVLRSKLTGDACMALIPEPQPKNPEK